MPGVEKAVQDAFCDWLLEVTRRTAAPRVRQDESDADRLKTAPEGARVKG